MIGDDLIIESELSINMLEEMFGHSFRGDRFQAWSNNYPLCKAMVYHDHERIETSRRREIGNQVNGKESEGDCCSGRDRNKGRGHRVHIRFHLLTKSATIDVFSDIGTEARPPVVMFDKFFHFKMARVTRCGVIMEIMSHDRGNISAIFVIQNGIYNFPVR
jgi:hypothetical protein